MLKTHLRNVGATRGPLLTIKVLKDLMKGPTYIIGHYNSSVSIIDLVSHTIYDMSNNFIRKWLDLQFKVDFER